MAKTPRQSMEDATPDKLVRVAYEQLSRQGFAKTSLDTIADKALVSAVTRLSASKPNKQKLL